MAELLNVAKDGDYNIKLLNDAFAGKAHMNEKVEYLEDEETGELRKRTVTKRPPRSFSNDPRKARTALTRDPNLDPVLE